MIVATDYQHIHRMAEIYRKMRETGCGLKEEEKVFLEAFDAGEVIEECARLLRECEGK